MIKSYRKARQLFLDARARQLLQHQVLDVGADHEGAALYLSHRKAHDERADLAERDRQTAEALRAYLRTSPSEPEAC